MTSVKAQAVKDKNLIPQGNQSFKNGDYPSAIGHYTQAILQDSKDWTFPLNRAAAYLKLDKYEDAERDCTTVLTLNKSNVKALFRRAQARRGLSKLDEAQKGVVIAFIELFHSVNEFIDLDLAVSIDPSNDLVKTELSSIKDQIWRISSQEVVHPMRRRVPIKIIEPSSSSLAADSPSPLPTATLSSGPASPSSLPEPVSLPTFTSTNPSAQHDNAPKPLSSSSSPSSPSSLPSSTSHSIATSASQSQDPAQPQSQSFQQAKRVRSENASKVSRVGGGIFRASGKSTIFPTRSVGTGTETTTAADNIDGGRSSRIEEQEGQVAGDDGGVHWAADVTLGTKTMSLFDFARGWDKLVKEGDGKGNVEKRFRYIMAIEPSSYPTMFQNSLEPQILTDMFRTFSAVLDEMKGANGAQSDVSDVVQLVVSMIGTALRNLTRVRRIKTVVMFLGRGEREMMRGVVRRVFEPRNGDGDGGDKEARDVWMSMLQ
ncbi:hypothetical protein D9757_007976 [Collybiopsis confluens]|uniref:RNA polymerase II-associated protein 3 n=1 Tax=Collybiopsis confluens TaxID=2823264 RepID=A0A8H5HBP1_9AGAR|nr:hypothetical protein D9757_007976 [Collybiopsis confluens]